MLGKFGQMHAKKIQLDHFLTPYTKKHSRCIKDLKMLRLEAIKMLDENIGSTIFGIALSNIFFWYISSGKENQRKINKWNYIKLQSSCTAKEIFNKAKRQLTEWEKIFANDISDKEFIPRIYKELSLLNNKKIQTIQLKSGQRTWRDKFPWRGHTDGQWTYEKMLNIIGHQKNAS